MVQLSPSLKGVNYVWREYTPKHEDLGLISVTYLKTLGVVACTCNLGAEYVETRPLAPTCLLAGLEKQSVSSRLVRDLVIINNREYPSGFCMHMFTCSCTLIHRHTPVHACTYTHRHTQNMILQESTFRCAMYHLHLQKVMCGGIIVFWVSGCQTSEGKNQLNLAMCNRRLEGT